MVSQSAKFIKEKFVYSIGFERLSMKCTPYLHRHNIIPQVADVVVQYLYTVAQSKSYTHLHSLDASGRPLAF